jgi:hypothetical protein
VVKGITIGGKPLKDHLEEVDHYDGTWNRVCTGTRSVLTGLGVLRLPAHFTCPPRR